MTNTYTLTRSKFQRAVCSTCRRVHTLHTVVEAVAAPRGNGAKALAKRAAQAALLALVLFGAGCRASQAPAQVVIEALAPSFDEVKFRRLTEALLEGAPLNEAVIVTVSAMNGLYWGQSWYDPDVKAYRIQIEAQQPMAMIVDTLLHEWAHLMIWDLPGDDAHDGLWGVAYARCYRIALRAQFEESGEARLEATRRASPAVGAP